MTNFIKGRLVAFAAGGLLLILFVVVFTQVALRASGYSLAWVEEFSAVAFIWLVFAGAAGAFFRREHLEVDLLYQSLAPRAPAAFTRRWDVCVEILTMLFLVVFAVGLALVTIQTWPNFMGTMPKFRFGMIYLGVLVFIILSVFIIGGRIIALLRQKRSEGA